MTTLLKSVVTAGALSVLTTFAAQADALKLAHSTWVGYGPFYIAQEKGFF
ncbi:MAG: ABC transporter substrate-binding protein, partial [Rhodobacteraceae bacterium]|nr:ABC transporter substrate-binding protein [Paracoccaceae bacterium]